jgi:hypothetical protein
MSGYIGTQPVPQATQTRDSFTATSGQTSFATGGYTPNFLDVYLNGVKLASADYTATNGSDVVLASGASTGDILEVVAFTTFNSASSSIDDNGNATAITIDSSENVQFGTTQTFPAFNNVVGCEVGGFGQISASRDGAEAMQLNRKSSDGNIAVFKKDGSDVGSIGAHLSGTYLGTADTGIYFNGGNDSIDPYNPSVPINRDNAISLGAGSRRFKDLYLSGGVYLGGTGSANKLDDYEEGTWTLTQGAQGTWNSPTFVGKYTKIGQLVTVTMEQNAGTISYSKTYYGGLPFPVSTTTHGYKGVGGASNGNIDDLGGIMAFSGTTQIYVLTGGSNQTNLIFSITYHTDS